MAINTIDTKPVTAQARYSTGSVTSRDGTVIGYHQIGHGPGVVLVHGAMESSQSHMQLAEALADAFTVYLPDRRERGMSGPHGSEYSIQEEVDDLDALLSQTGANHIFGVSSGGVISLQAAHTLPAVRKAAIYEPPLSFTRSEATAILTRYDAEMAQGKAAAALVTGMKATQMGPRVFNLIPRPLLEMLTNMVMASEDKKATGDDVTMRMLAPTLHYDFQLVTEMSEKLESFRAMDAEVLLLGGSKSPAYLKVALDDLEKVLPHFKRIEFPGLGHGGSGNRNRGGQPDRVAQELRRFFA